MSKLKGSSGGSSRQESKSGRWALFVTVFTFFVTIALGLLANNLFKIIPVEGALALQLLLECAGVFCDLIGIAEATTDMPPFHSMASKKVAGADRGLWLIKHAERVTNLFNDVMGDIFGVLSGATGAVIVVMLIDQFKSLGTVRLYADIVMTSLIAALLVGGKSAGKSFAMRNSKEIVLWLGKVMGFFMPKRAKPGRKH
jgi:CBS domain containing-hemolysin-like protein